MDKVSSIYGWNELIFWQIKSEVSLIYKVVFVKDITDVSIVKGKLGTVIHL